MWIEDFAGKIQPAGGLETLFFLCLSLFSSIFSVSFLPLFQNCTSCSVVYPPTLPSFVRSLSPGGVVLNEKGKKNLISGLQQSHLAMIFQRDTHRLMSIYALCLTTTFQHHKQNTCRLCDFRRTPMDGKETTKKEKFKWRFKPMHISPGCAQFFPRMCEKSFLKIR